MVAALRIRLERLAAIGDPFDRPLQLAGRPRHQGFLGIDYLFAAEAAADIGRHDTQLAFRNSEDQNSDQHPRDMGKLGRGIKRVIAGRGLILSQSSPRFHCVGHQSIVDEIDLGEVMGPGKGGVGRG